MGAHKSLYTEELQDKYVTREETKIGECQHCKADIIEIYEKDDTPGFRSKDRWTIYNCECRYYMDKSKKEIWEDTHKYYKQDVIPKYEEEVKRLKETLKIYKQGKFICNECNGKFDNEEKEYCDECGVAICPNCYKDNNNMCYDCASYDPYDC